MGSGPEEDPEDTLEDEDDIVRSDLDMHSLILTSNPQDSSVSQALSLAIRKKLKAKKNSRKKLKLKEKTKTQAQNSNFRHFV